MSASPSPYHDSRPTSPQNAAEVRSAAIAKLKRAASLPRRTDGRRPSQTTVDTGNVNGSASTPIRRSGQDHDEEVLSPSPTNMGFEESTYQPYSAGGHGLQRSNSASSSFHIPTPPHLSGYSQVGTPILVPGSSGQPSPHSDWSGLQQAQTYIPSLSPMPTGHTVSGRNTPSPLPSLGELRTLQRSNSAAARARAMDKLTGGRETPAFEDQALDLTPTRPGLQRADSLGAPRGGGPTKSVPTRTDHPPVAFVDPRPRLQRSFTVGGSNMGEERRSAVGRRMVARLGERRAARDAGENEVEKIWEERRAAADSAEVEEDGEAEEYGGQQEETEDDHQDLLAEQESNQYHPDGGIPGVIRHSPTEPSHRNPDLYTRNGTLGVPEDDRPGSRTTQISDSDAFEYDLRRSLSSRTARGAVGTVTESRSAPRSRQAHHIERLDQEDEEDEPEPGGLSGRQSALNDLGLPNPPFATPSRHTARGSGSTDSTHSPGGDSMLSGDGLQSMMFVMGRGSTENGMKRDTTGFPVDVDEGGASHWGTPAKDLQLHPSASSLSDSPTPASFTHPTSSAIDQTLSPLELSARSSVMSWESLGGERDREIPTDPNYPESSPNGHPRKNGSISRTVSKVKDAMRKRSQSRSSTGSATSPPTSPKSLGEALAVAVQTFGGRRGSASSVSPSRSSVARSFARGSPMTPQGDHMRHQPSSGSLAPSFLDELSANGMLLQHQLANDPQPILEMPRAKKDDPRVFNSKLSPFPGIEGRKMGDNLSVPDHPRLIHQNSDSVVPSQRRVTREVQDTIYALPLQPPPAARCDRRGSEDSIGRKGWLAKAFGAANSPRSSGGTMSRKSSMTDQSHHSVNRSSPDKHPSFSEPDNDPFAAPPPPQRSRAVSPGVSTVAEVNEEGNRMTQFTVHRSATHTPVHPDIEEESGLKGILEEGGNRGRSLQPRSMEILARMDEILALEQEDPARPDILDDPPRKLLLATQVLQVVDRHTVKDRYLLLFNDILAICKPVIENGPSANLDMRFVVKSVVALDQLDASGFTDESSSQNSDQPAALITEFITRFAQDPFSACSFLIERNRWKNDLHSLAEVIFRTPLLDKAQLGHVLSSEPDLLAAYIDSFNFFQIPIQDAFRMFLLSLRLPSHPDSIERIINAFASSYFRINKQNLSYDLERTHSLVSGMMMLNDSLHDGTFGFAMYNPGLTVTVWIAAYGERDPHRLVSDELLRSIYVSIQKYPLQPPLPAEHGIQAKSVVLAGKLPGRLTHNAWSEPITITLPAIDHDFTIRLMGEGLQMEPASLDFSRSKEATFRIKGTTLGTKTLLFARLGRNAPLYASLDNGKPIHVERAFMKHTFHLTFANHLGRDRKYCLSVPDAELRTKWGVLLPRQIAITRQKKSTPIATTQQKVRALAAGTAMCVLRDALIPPPTPSVSGQGRMDRSGSVSVVYPKDSIGRSKNGEDHKSNEIVREGPRGFMKETTGKEVVLVCRQNSLLPGMLELLQAGVEPKDRGARF